MTSGGGTSGDATVRRHLVVRGRVQGVFYRASTGEQAQRLGLSGWVMNRPDGAVEAEVEGPEPAVAQLVTWCRQGPPRARVSAVEVVAVPTTGETGFDVR